jgi:hypothetical protein
LKAAVEEARQAATDVGEEQKEIEEDIRRAQTQKKR